VHAPFPGGTGAASDRTVPRLDRLPARAKGGAIHVVIECPRGSRNKLKYDPELEAFTLSRPLVLGVAYPYDWGFVPSTHAPDGDPLDAMVLLDAPTHPGAVITCRPLGVLVITQRRERDPGRERNDRVVAVPEHGPRWQHARALPKRWRDELERFFLAAVFLEGKDLRVEGWRGARAAERLVDEAARAFERAGG